LKGEIILENGLAFLHEHSAPIGAESCDDAVLGQEDGELYKLPVHVLDSQVRVIIEGIVDGDGHVLIEQIKTIVFFHCASQVDCVLMRNALQLLYLLDQLIVLFLIFGLISLFDEGLIYLYLADVEDAEWELEAFHLMDHAGGVHCKSII
jgi:hypothetical protein